MTSWALPRCSVSILRFRLGLQCSLFKTLNHLHHTHPRPSKHQASGDDGVQPERLPLRSALMVAHDDHVCGMH